MVSSREGTVKVWISPKGPKSDLGVMKKKKRTVHTREGTEVVLGGRDAGGSGRVLSGRTRRLKKTGNSKVKQGTANLDEELNHPRRSTQSFQRAGTKKK